MDLLEDCSKMELFLFASAAKIGATELRSRTGANEHHTNRARPRGSQNSN